MARSNYSDYFNFKMPVLRRETSSRQAAGLYTGVGDRRTVASRYVVDSGGGRPGFDRGPGFGDRSGGNDQFDAIMAGLDAESSGYANALKGIYDKYQGYVTDYEGDVKPIIEAMNEDIVRLSDYVSDYEQTVDGMEDTFTSGIQLDPSARRRRSEYMGSVAGQYDAAEEGMNRDMASQGLNPYAAKGAKRKFALARAGSVAGASNKAFSDWREQYNRDVVAKQSGMANYADLKSRVPGMYSQVAGARGNVAGVYGNILSAKLGASQAKARGYEGLLDRTEQRRTEALAFQQNKTNIDMGTAAAASKMQTDLVNSGRGNWR